MKAYSRSPHENLNCLAAISHFLFTFVSPCGSYWSVLGAVCHYMLAYMFVLQCKLEQQACLTGKELTLKCSGLCPCPTPAPTPKDTKHGKKKHTAMVMATEYTHSAEYK